MFGIDDKEVKVIQARVLWITQCAVLIIQKLGEFLKIELPPPHA